MGIVRETDSTIERETDSQKEVGWSREGWMWRSVPMRASLDSEREVFPALCRLLCGSSGVLGRRGVGPGGDRCRRVPARAKSGQAPTDQVSPPGPTQTHPDGCELSSTHANSRKLTQLLIGQTKGDHGLFRAVFGCFRPAETSRRNPVEARPSAQVQRKYGPGVTHEAYGGASSTALGRPEGGAGKPQNHPSADISQLTSAPTSSRKLPQAPVNSRRHPRPSGDRHLLQATATNAPYDEHRSPWSNGGAMTVAGQRTFRMPASAQCAPSRRGGPCPRQIGVPIQRKSPTGIMPIGLLSGARAGIRTRDLSVISRVL